MTSPTLARAASLLCALHCVALPVATVVLPSVASGWIASERAEHALLLVAALGVAGTLVPGWRRHRRPAPLLLGVAGLALLWGGHAAGWPEAVIGGTGGAAMLGAQWLERRAGCDHGRACACSGADPGMMSAVLDDVSRSAPSAPPAAAS